MRIKRKTTAKNVYEIIAPYGMLRFIYQTSTPTRIHNLHKPFITSLRKRLHRFRCVRHANSFTLLHIRHIQTAPPRSSHEVNHIQFLDRELASNSPQYPIVLNDACPMLQGQVRPALRSIGRRCRNLSSSNYPNRIRQD